MSSSKYSTAALRAHVGHPFSNNDEQHSVDEFLDKICERSNILRAHLLSKIKYEKFCRICNFESENIEDELFLKIYFKKNVKGLKSTQSLLLQQYNRTENLPETCPLCRNVGDVRCRISVHEFAKIVVVRIMLHLST